MRVVVTGGAGFIGRSVVRILRERGDHIVALLRDPSRAGDLADQAGNVELVADDLSDAARLTDRLRGADAVIHIAGSYRVGIPNSERPAMWDANVGTTTRVLDAAQSVGVPRIVYVSTVNVFGNTHGQTVDETFRRDLGDGFLSWYDETKYRSHEVAKTRIAAGAPVVIVQPGFVYGPGDHSGLGAQLRLASEGRLRYRAMEDMGIGLVHVADLAAGIVAALDRGRLGESYTLSGPRMRLRDAIVVAAGLSGRRPPRLRIPTTLLRAIGPLGRLIGRANLGEVVSATAGVTYWASSAKAERELGFKPRGIDEGFRDAFRDTFRGG